jgi:glycine/D-amino acid oxidase-like deaminating enzyme
LGTVDDMRAVVIGAGAWGLPAAAELARRGHDVTLIDRFGVANDLSSSPGPTRIWRLAHPDRVRVRLALRSVEAMERLAERTGTEVFLRRGLLWRDDETVAAVAAALAAEGVEHELVAAAEVGQHLAGLRPDGRDAVFQPEAGPVLAAASMAAQRARFTAAGGTLAIGRTARQVDVEPNGIRVEGDDGLSLRADVVVVAPGPGAVELFAALGVEVPLRPRLEQVVHFGPAGGTVTDDLPCWFEGPVGGDPGLYAMPTPGRGYKVGLDLALRDLADGDLDRTPDAALLEAASGRVARSLPSLDPRPLDAQVCSWTTAPDNRFVIDTLSGGIVLAGGDGGEGFKFSALMGEVLADLAEGAVADADVASFGLARFADGYPDEEHVLGR